LIASSWMANEQDHLLSIHMYIYGSYRQIFLRRAYYGFALREEEYYCGWWNFRCIFKKESLGGTSKCRVARFTTNEQPVRSAYQPPASSTFLSEQTSHQQPASSTLLSEQISISHQPPANRTGWKKTAHMSRYTWNYANPIGSARCCKTWSTTSTN
jgi:hypothetical protein